MQQLDVEVSTPANDLDFANYRLTTNQDWLTDVQRADSIKLSMNYF